MDLRTTMTEVLRHNGLRIGNVDPGTIVIYDTDHTEVVNAAAEALKARFASVVIITLRDKIATEVPMVNRQGILRRMAEQRIDVVVLAEPIWNDSFGDGKLGLVNIYSGDIQSDHDLAMLTYASPREPNGVLLYSLQQAGFAVIQVGDARAPQEIFYASASGHEAGNAF